jgi:hypothetical protein
MQSPASPSLARHVTDAESEQYVIDWSPDFRSCTARTQVRTGEPPLAVTFHSAEPVTDTMARLRMERAAVEALERLGAL